MNFTEIPFVRYVGGGFLVVVFALASGPGCVSMGADKAQDDIRALKEQVWALQKQTAELGLKVSGNSEDIALLTERLQTLEGAKEASEQDDIVIEEIMTPEADQRNGKAGKAPEDVAAAGAEAQAAVVETPGAPAGPVRPAPVALDGSDGSAGHERMAGTALVAADGAQAEVEGLGEKALYKRAMSIFNSGDYFEAAESFRYFIHRSPGSPLAGNAQYWLGESYYNLQRYDRAAEEFRRALALYPGGGRAADSMLKLGFCNIKMNRVSEGEKILEDLIEKYPLSVAASTARRELEKQKKHSVGARSGDS